jgi:hypothetical protein
MLSHFYITCTALHFTFTLSLLVHVPLQTQTTPKIGRDIIPDILSLKTTRAFWRQNNFNINKPAPLGAKLPGAFHWKCSTPFYSGSASLDRISLLFRVYKLMSLIK